MNGIVVLGTLPGSAAESEGLRYGDVVLAVNGEAMSSVEDFLRARALVKESMTVLVRRGDHVFETTMQLNKKAPTEGLEKVASELRSAMEQKPTESRILN